MKKVATGEKFHFTERIILGLLGSDAHNSDVSNLNLCALGCQRSLKVHHLK